MEKKLRSLGLRAAFTSDLGEAKHMFTHRIWNMRLYRYTVESAVPLQNAVWADTRRLRELPLPTAMKKARQAALKILEESEGDPSC